MAAERQGSVLGGEEALQAELAALQQAVAAERAEREALQGQLLAAHRRALLAEHHGQVVEDLVQGDSVAALDAAVERAREAHTRIVEQVRRQQATVAVPVGNAARTGPRLEGLSPQAKIAAGLRGA